ncbi:MAG TPA: hypothetical protein VKY44_09500 [Flavobacterium sp.]|nr:hypothetical protein [Flavobacterium sp.]
MYIPKSVTKPKGNKSPGASAPKEPNVTIVDVDDILSFPERDEKGVLMQGSFVMKPNANMIQVYMTPSKSKASFESEGDEDAQQFKHKFEGEHPGNELEIAEFVQNFTGRNVIIIYGSCSDTFRKVLGSKCAPLQLKPSLQDDNDARKHMLVFEQAAATGFVPGHYVGEIVLGEPFAASSANLTIANNRLMQKLPASAAETDVTVASITAAADSVVTLIGSGGATPSVLEASANVLLKGGADWTALDGAVIHFKVFEGATKMLIELSRA